MKNIFLAIDYEFNKLRKDFIALVILFAGCIFYSFYYPFPYVNEIAENIPVAIIDEDKSDLSRQIIRMLEDTQNIKVITEYTSVGEAKEGFMERKVFGIINIPSNFYRDVVFGNKPSVTLFSDGSYMIFYSTALATSMEIVLTVAAGVKIKQLSMAGVPSYDVLNIQSSVSTVIHPLFNSIGSYDNFVIPAVYTLILQQVFLIVIFLIMGGGYELGYNFPAKVGVWAILAGRVLFYFPLFMLAFGVVFYIGAKVFGLPVLGSFWDLIIFVTPYGLSIIGLGFACGYFIREREGGMLFALMTSIPFLFMSGFLWPISIFPSWLQWLRLIVPSSAGIDGVVRIRQMGATIYDVMPAFINLWVLAIVYLSISFFVLKWQMKQTKIQG